LLNLGVERSLRHTRDVFYDYNVRDLMTDARFDSWTGEGITFGYDGFGRMTSTSNNMDGTRTVSSSYDAAGQRTGLSLPNGDDYSYAYDPAGHLTGITDVTDPAAPDGLFTFSYDAMHRINLRSGPRGSAVDAGFDRLDRLSSLAHTFTDAADNVSYSYTYNPGSQIETRTRSNDAYAWTGGYNVSRGYTVNGRNQYTRTNTGVTYSYDANGNLTGTDTSSTDRTYIYDVENRLIQVRTGTAINATLRYDPLGRLYEIIGASTRRLIWDGDALVAEYADTGSLAATYLHGTGSGDDPIMWRGGGEDRAIHADHQGSVIAIANHAGAAQWINAGQTV
jgi:YD repeat-containing protein